MSNGEKFDVRHPQMAAMLKTNLIISRPDSDQFDICSLLHVSNVIANGSQAPGR